MPLSLASGSPAPHDDSVRDVTLATFKLDVLEASKQALVLVDFWAPWCGPCKQLTPILEKIVRASQGLVRLAKIDVDRNQPIAQQMGVQSVPAVFAFSQGRPVDAFAGALPEAQVKSWVDQILKTIGAPVGEEKPGYDTAFQQAEDFLASNDAPTARAIYADILDMEPENATAYLGLIRCFLAEDNVTAAREMVNALPPAMSKDKNLVSLLAQLELAEQTASSSLNFDELLSQVSSDPSNNQARFDLAMAYYGAGKREEAVDSLLDIVKRNRGWNEDAARKQLVKLFEAFGVMDPLTVSARKRLSSIMFS